MRIHELLEATNPRPHVRVAEVSVRLGKRLRARLFPPPRHEGEKREQVANMVRRGLFVGGKLDAKLPVDTTDLRSRLARKQVLASLV